MFASCIIYNIPVRAYQPFETPDEESESSDDLTTLEEESLSDAPRPPPASLRKQTKKGVAWTQPDQDFTIGQIFSIFYIQQGLRFALQLLLGGTQRVILVRRGPR